MAEPLLAVREHTGYVPEIQHQIHHLLAARTPKALTYGQQFTQVWHLVPQCIAGGKLLRPLLLMKAFDALDSDLAGRAQFRESALRIAAAIEMLHFSFLLHDDVIDEDLLRRGKPNLIGTLLQEPATLPGPATAPTSERLHWARSNGILAGDLILAAAHQVFAREDLPGPIRTRLLDLLDQAVTDSIAGEQSDVALSHEITGSSLESVLEMNRLKTATYTFELPLKAAAVLAGASARVEEALGHIGQNLGVAFQLQDDLLSAFGHSETHGKDDFSDVREGKETVLIAYARTTNSWPQIAPHLGVPQFTHQNGLEIQALLTHCGAESFTRAMIDGRIAAARTIALDDQSGVPAALAQFVLGLVEKLEGRVS